MRTILPLAAFLVMALPAPAQQPLPVFTGERTDGTTVELPTASHGRYLIVGMAYGQKAGPLLEEWYGPAYLRFVAKHGLFASDIEADVYFVPLFVGVNKAAYNSSMKRLREGSDPDVARRVLFVKEAADALRDVLDLKDKGSPYILVMDPQGVIIHREEGKFTEEKLEAIEAAVTQ
jgi:hypothetical protein